MNKISMLERQFQRISRLSAIKNIILAGKRKPLFIMDESDENYQPLDFSSDRMSHVCDRCGDPSDNLVYTAEGKLCTSCAAEYGRHRPTHKWMAGSEE